MSIIPTKLLCLFPTLGTYNLDNNNGLHNLTNTNKFKWSFNPAFIKSCPLTGNHDQKKVGLSFAGCKYLDADKFNE